jgi:hypothetical protein
MLVPTPAKIRCRQITDADLVAVAGLLAEGFPRRKLAHWRVGLDRMAERKTPDNTPKYGYCLEADGAMVGVILMISCEKMIDDSPSIFTNLASWYVKPDYRPYAHQLAAMALKNKTTSYTNVTAAPSTWQVVENQGYRKYCNGLYFAAAALARPKSGVEISDFAATSNQADVQSMNEFELCQRHVQWGCKVLVVKNSEKLSAFIFRRFAMRSGLIKLPAMFVVHAPSQDAVIELAGNIGRYFASQAAPLLAFDANGPISGLSGFYTEKRGRKFVKGPHQPRLCDLTDTEFSIFEI